MKGKKSLLLAILFATIITLGAWKFWIMLNEWKQANKRLISLEIRYYKTLQDLTDYKNQADLLNQKTAVLKADNAKLSKEKQELQQKIADLETEEEIIKAKLHSIKELKQAIRQVKIEMSEQQMRQLLIRKEQQKALDAQELAFGNRGFLTKNRQSTYKPKIRIEVMPVN